ncbi:MAG: transposase [bacterium]
MADEEHIYQRDLPHWRAAEAIYFVTWRVTAERRFLFPDQRATVVAALRHFDAVRYELLAYVVMDDHVHVLVEPRGVPLSRIVHSWKSFTAHTLGGGRVWQPEYQDRIVRDDIELHRKLRYVLENPQRRWPGAKAYPFVWAKPDLVRLEAQEAVP